MTAVELIKRVEGCRLEAYPDPGTHGEPYTIGYGHTGPDVQHGSIWTQVQVDEALTRDLEKSAKGVDARVKVPITATERAALISFAFNEGLGRLDDPRCRILRLLNAGDHLSAAGQFMHWTMAGGQHILVSRRMIEVEVFLSELGVL